MTSGHYKGHYYKIEEYFKRMRGSNEEALSSIKLYVDGNSIIADKKFTQAHQSMQAIQAHIDNLEAQNEIDKLESQSTVRVVMIGPHGPISRIM